MKTISVLIPAYNEEKRLPKTLQLWQKFMSHPPAEKQVAKNNEIKIREILIIDDGSEDKTILEAKKFENSLPIKIIHITPNKGKGNAVRQGVKNAKGDFIFIYDADAAVLPQTLSVIFAESKNSDIVIGSRTSLDSKTKMSFFRRFVGICFHILCFPLLPKIKDASCGAKLLKKTVAKKIFAEQKINRFAFDIEMLWLAKKMNFKIKEIGISWQEIPGSKVNVLRDAPEMFFSVLGLYKKAILSKLK